MNKEAVSIVVIKGNSVYWGLRLNKADNYGKIEFPGGKREILDPTPIDSARRELSEEMGVQVKNLISLGAREF